METEADADPWKDVVLLLLVKMSLLAEPRVVSPLSLIPPELPAEIVTEDAMFVLLPMPTMFAPEPVAIETDAPLVLGPIMMIGFVTEVATLTVDEDKEIPPAPPAFRVMEEVALLDDPIEIVDTPVVWVPIDTIDPPDCTVLAIATVSAAVPDAWPMEILQPEAKPKLGQEAGLKEVG